LVPNWCWLIFGMMLACCGFHEDHKRRFVGILFLWTVFTWLFVEEAHSLVRGVSLSPVEWQTAHENGRGLRVVSLNCSLGQARCVREVQAWQPDIVLLQESPGSEQLRQLAADLFGADGTFLYGGDVSILARRTLHARFFNPTSHFVHAEVQLPTGVLVDVISLRLAPPVSRIDFWKPGFWSDHRHKRIEHREQIADLMRHVQSFPATHHLIVGGDFNALPADDALAALGQRLTETFSIAGRGWGATGTNEYPLFRVDQIWASSNLSAESVTAQKTLYSDHRMVVCDLIIGD
ncbi:MAG: endonuclease/exonuclease/phosphatase family protein, partial [Rhodopirellula sp.]|nr:endonuclease/exonuclease/phosphatase family protein [Rhodopirellula sp.]